MRLYSSSSLPLKLFFFVKVSTFPLLNLLCLSTVCLALLCLVITKFIYSVLHLHLDDKNELKTNRKGNSSKQQEN